MYKAERLVWAVEPNYFPSTQLICREKYVSNPSEPVGATLSSFKGAQAFFLTSGYKEKEDWDAALERSVIGSTVACPNEHDATLSVVFYLPGAS